MRVTDILLIALPAFAGLVFLVRSFQKTSLPSSIIRMPNRVIEIHRSLQGKLVEGKQIPLPGGMLVTSLRGWAAGEIVWISVMSIWLAAAPSLPGAVLSCFSGLLLGGFILLLSLREQGKKQLAGVRSALPVASFLLSLLLEAGMGSHAALQEVARAIPKGPLARELEEISRARMLGISREEALDRSRRRVPLDDYHIFLNLIRQGERLGVGLSRGLREHSAKMLEGEGYRAEAMAQKAAVKLLFPLVVFIFPAVALIIFSPIILNLWELWGH